MKKIKCMAVFAMLVMMAMFSSCGAKAMSIGEAVEAINNLEHGGSITIVLNKDTDELTEDLREALSADMSYLEELAESEGLLSEDPTPEEVTKFLQKYAKKVKLDLSKTKITEIGDSAFEGCISLASVIIPNSVTSIGDSAFSLCESLTSVSIPNGVTSIGEFAFSRCTLLTSVSIPNSVAYIGNGAFTSCSNLAISVAESNRYFSSKDGVLYNKDKTILIAWPSARNSVTIPNSVTSIGDGAFAMCYSLTSVTIPDSVMSIGKDTFTLCTSLTSMTIPDSVTSIGDGAFSGCESLTNVTIPGSVTSIGDFAFFYCESLTSVTIPDSVTSIGDGAFAGCETLHVEIEPHPYGNLKVHDNTFESSAMVSFRGTTGTWKEIFAKYWH